MERPWIVAAGLVSAGSLMLSAGATVSLVADPGRDRLEPAHTTAGLLAFVGMVLVALSAVAARRRLRWRWIVPYLVGAYALWFVAALPPILVAQAAIALLR